MRRHQREVQLGSILRGWRACMDRTAQALQQRVETRQRGVMCAVFGGWAEAAAQQAREEALGDEVLSVLDELLVGGGVLFWFFILLL